MCDNIKQLDKKINKVRDSLNKLSLYLDDEKEKDKLLNVSRLMDELIIEYMKKENSF